MGRRSESLDALIPMTQPIPPRRRFRFSLRGLLVLVTTIAIAVGWIGVQLDWIRNRQAVLRRAYGAQGVRGMNGWIAEPPWPLALFNEDGYCWILLYFPDPVRLNIAGSGPGHWQQGERLLRDDERRELTRARKLFPEALVQVTFLSSPESRH